MPIQKESSRVILNKEEALKRLQELCSKYDMVKDLTPQKTYIFSVLSSFETEDGPPMLAVNKYEDDLYAVYAPDWLTHQQYKVFSFFMHYFFKERIIVFSKPAYDAAMECIGDKKVIIYHVQ